MKNLLVYLLIPIFMLVGCASPPTPEPVVIETEAPSPEPTPEPTLVLTPEVTPTTEIDSYATFDAIRSFVLTQTAQAAEAMPPTPTPSPDDLWARNYVGSFDSGGVIVEIVRVLVGYKHTIPDIRWDLFSKSIEGFADTEVVGELIFKVTNNTDVTASVYPYQGIIQIGEEQIELSDYIFGILFGEFVHGVISPGETKIGGLWFGIQGSTPSEITQIIFRYDAPYEVETQDALGPNYEIVMDVSTHVWEELPDELKGDNQPLDDNRIW